MIISVLIVLILIVVNGIFSASELAFLSLDKFDLASDLKSGNKKAKKVDKLLKDSSSFLSTIQIGITLAGFLASAFAADYFADFFLERISLTIINAATTKTILVLLITIILSYLTLVFGELVPKRIAINYPKKVAYTFVSLIGGLNRVFYPLVKVLTFSTELICKIFKIENKKDDLTEEDIKKMIIMGKEEGILEEKEKEYILNVFDFNDIEVEKVMTPKKDIVLLDVDAELKDNIAKIKTEKYTRFPVYKNTKDNIIGILNVKDLILRHSETNELKLSDIVRPVKKVKHNDKIDDIFRIMQLEKDSLRIVYKDKKFIGIVTIEDAIEEIVGNIYDEYDSEKA